eukprot:scaffold8371_cov199-Amphora_coffeaeformis.AAC.9
MAYFGGWEKERIPRKRRCQEQVDDVRLYPVMLKKGTTQIGLYGLGSMRDERLNRMWREGKVKFFRYQKEQDDDEEASDDNDEDVFNMFVLHQNRDVGRGTKNCVQETLIPEFCDLVVWGHEHECQIEFTESLVGTFRITQPGSSVATSLVAGEAVRKKVGVLDINGKNFRMHTVPLTQVRSFVMSDMNLREHRANLDPDDSKIDKKITRVLEEQVNAIIMDAKEERIKILQEAKEAGSNAADDDSPLVGRLFNPEKVLVRLRVEHTNFQTLNNQRFGAKFVDEIANSDNILLFRKEKKSSKTVESKATRKAREAIRKPIDPEELERTNVEDLVASILELPGSKLELLSEKGLGEALEEYVDKNNLLSIPNVSEEQLKKRQKVLISNKDFAGKAEDVKDVFHQNDELQMEEKEAQPVGNKSKSTIKSKIKKEPTYSWEEEEEENLENSRDSASSRKSTAKPSKQRSTAGRGKHKVADSDDDDDDDVVVVDDDDDDETPRKAPTKSRPRRSSKKVNYGGDDGDNSDAVVDMTDAAREDDDDVMEVEPPKPKGRKMIATSSRGRATAAASKPTPSRRKAAAASSARKTSRKKKFQLDSDDDDEDGAGASIGLDDNWGSAATRSQY